MFHTRPFAPLLFILLLAGGLAARADGGAQIAEFKARAGNMSSTAISDDGKLVFTGEDDGLISLWNVAVSGTTVRNFMGHFPRPVIATALLHDGQRGVDGHVVLWDTHHWVPAALTLPDADKASVGALAFSSDSRLLATGYQNGAGFVWNTRDGSLYSSFAGYANPEATPTPPVAPVFPGSTITPENRSTIEHLFFSRDNSTLFGSIQDAPARFWDAKSGAFLGTADYFQDYTFYIARFDWTPNPPQ